MTSVCVHDYSTSYGCLEIIHLIVSTVVHAVSSLNFRGLNMSQFCQILLKNKIFMVKLLAMHYCCYELEIFRWLCGTSHQQTTGYVFLHHAPTH